MKKSLSKNAFLSAIRVFANVLFPLVTYPYLTRVLSVDGIGQVDFSYSIVNYFLLMGGLGIGTFATRTGAAIREDKLKLEKFACQIFTINCISCLISLVLLFFLLILPSSLSSYRVLILIQSVSLICAPLGVDWLYNLEEDFTYITIRSLIVQLISMVCLFLFIHSYKDLYIYVCIKTFSNGFANIFNWRYSKKYINLHFVKDTNWRDYKKSILVFFGNTITQTIYLNSDVTLIGLLTNDFYVGLYSVATKIYNIVKQVFNAAISVAIPRLSNYVIDNKENFFRLTYRILHFAMVIVIPAVIGLILFRKEIILLISGNGYEKASSTLGILSVALMFAILANIVNNGILVPLGKEDKVLKGATISATANILLNFIFIPFFKQDGAALTTLIAECLMFFNGVRYIKDEFRLVINKKDIVRIIVGCLIMVRVYILISNHDIFYIEFSFILKIFICGSSYILTMYLLNDSEIRYFINKFIKISK